jgi:HSP20 family protein
MQVVRFSYPNGYFRVNPAVLQSEKVAKPENAQSQFQPKVNILNTNDAYVIQFSVPGYKKDQFSISSHNDELQVKATADQASTDANYQRKEFNVLDFETRFKLAEDVVSELIVASYSDGVLSVTLPKKAKEEPRSIDVKIN